MPAWTWWASVLSFALASSISPGPVNLLTLSNTLSGYLNSSFRFITGATVGFMLQLLILGTALQPLLRAWPWLETALHIGGVLFLLWLAWLLWRDSGQLDDARRRPADWHTGLALQWLNPKAYLAAAAAVGLYAGGNPQHLYWLTAAYGAVCWLSLAAWIGLGCLLRRHAQSPRRMRALNRLLSVLLLLGIGLML
ncbi:LysE family translocator [Neisseria shayeganii]|uniref:LysE family transporter n=1 Tax=Neisseria shayeganii TaxID=607712 RepID=A0A7D7NAD1_9NEIS|nr:LysE family transporter [Neisseria shayeganii]QMT39755.1 LysE family transporter [Neisseria shayeganii]